MGVSQVLCDIFPSDPTITYMSSRGVPMESGKSGTSAGYFWLETLDVAGNYPVVATRTEEFIFLNNGCLSPSH